LVQGGEAELKSEVFADKDGNEQSAMRNNIVAAIQQQNAFGGYVAVHQ